MITHFFGLFMHNIDCIFAASIIAMFYDYRVYKNLSILLYKKLVLMFC